ncbi:MAG TPA: methyltransferase domain-containing protein [Bryobacteraceae bacterium]|nr:methyltransferase domain-containing protein [Bryobacteraceae bacterium]
MRCSTYGRPLSINADFANELQWWDRELGLDGDYPEAIKYRLIADRPNPHYPHDVTPLLEEAAQRLGRLPKLLDLGSGPLSMLAWGHHAGHFELTAVDPLANDYTEALMRHGHSQTSPILQGYGESLDDLFAPDTFDFVWTHNALDHTQYPRVVMEQISRVLAPGGNLLLQGWSREATSAGFVGLHRHDLYLAPGPVLMCDTYTGEGTRLHTTWLDYGLPLDVVTASEPTPEAHKWIRVLYRKAAH